MAAGEEISLTMELFNPLDFPLEVSNIHLLSSLVQDNGSKGSKKLKKYFSLTPFLFRLGKWRIFKSFFSKFSSWLEPEKKS
jgi:hypothetical protein